MKPVYAPFICLNAAPPSTIGIGLCYTRGCPFTPPPLHAINQFLNTSKKFLSYRNNLIIPRMIITNSCSALVKTCTALDQDYNGVFTQGWWSTMTMSITFWVVFCFGNNLMSTYKSCQSPNSNGQYFTRDPASGLKMLCREIISMIKRERACLSYRKPQVTT